MKDVNTRGNGIKRREKVVKCVNFFQFDTSLTLLQLARISSQI